MNIEKFYRCGEQLKEKPYHYDMAGLEGIYLLNGYTIEHKYGEEFVSITDVEGLHQQIGRHLVLNRKVLSPREIRFVRKTMDLTQNELGKMLGTSSQSVARWEKGLNEMPGASERLMRAIFMVSLLPETEVDQIRKFLTSQLIQLDCKDEVKIIPTSFELKESWHESDKLIAA